MCTNRRNREDKVKKKKKDSVFKEKWDRMIYIYKDFPILFRFLIPPFVFIIGFVFINLICSFLKIGYPIPLIFTVLLLLQVLVFDLRVTVGPSIIDRVLSLSLIVIVASPIIVYLFLILASNLSLFYVRIGGEDAWIGFAGSIIGGSLTMLALVFTLKQQDDIRKSDKTLSIMPILSIEPENGTGKDFNIDVRKFVILNLSNNHAIDARIIGTRFSVLDLEGLERGGYYETPGSTLNSDNFLLSPLKGNIRYPFEINFNPAFFESKEKVNKIAIDIYYSDIMKGRKYITCFSLFYKAINTKDSKGKSIVKRNIEYIKNDYDDEFSNIFSLRINEHDTPDLYKGLNDHEIH